MCRKGFGEHYGCIVSLQRLRFDKNILSNWNLLFLLPAIVWKILRYRVQRPNNLLIEDHWLQFCSNKRLKSNFLAVHLTYLGIGQRMIHETNATHHLSCFANMGGTIRWITVDLFTLCSFVSWPYAGNLARLIKYNLVNRFVQHVGASVDRAESGKTLRQFS